MITIFLGLFNLSILSPESFFGFSVTDILDILVIAFIMYRLVIWIKNTKAKSLFKGISVILVMSVLAFFLQLNTVLWLLNSFFSIGLLAVVVIFQPEIRKALEEMGKGKINNPFSEHIKDENADFLNAVEELIKALRILSKTRTGALIVLEKDEALTETEATGVKIDALITSQLLISIFYDKTPLHDGAVLVRGSRLAAASCILPLTASDIAQDLGTRHRAALGVNEAYNAQAIIVSEETGFISIAEYGKLITNITLDQVKQALLGENIPIKKKFVLWRAINEKNNRDSL